jgi:hypothetical protein
MLNRLFGWLRRAESRENDGEPTEAVATIATVSTVGTVAAGIAAPLDQTVRIDELNDAAAIAGSLFRRKFGQEIPDFPRHFVAMIGGTCAGYVHYTAWQGDYLCGGLCIDDRAYRALSAEQRDWLRERGGIAEIMMRHAHAALTDGATIWGYIGDKQAEAVDRRVGFEKVAEPYLFAIWRKPISEEGKRRRIAEAVKLGGF